MRTLLRTRIRQMSADDIAQITEIERESFTSQWPQTAYKRELQNKLARYIVIVDADDRVESEDDGERHGLVATLRKIVSTDTPARPERLLGFIGIWLMVGEAHIVTVAVREQYRRMGIGERLLIACIELARAESQEVVTLEVRKSNEEAQQLYYKYGFLRMGLRVRYYTDNHEDAVIMTTPELDAPSFQARFTELRDAHRANHPDLWE